jgi:anti-anti-sigma factor
MVSKRAMDYRIRQTGGVTEIALSGQMTFVDHDKFRQVMTAFDGPSGHRMVFDLSDLEFVDSSGLGMFLIARDLAEKKRLGLSLRGVRNDVRRLMDLARFERVIPIAE